MIGILRYFGINFVEQLFKVFYIMNIFFIYVFIVYLSIVVVFCCKMIF